MRPEFRAEIIRRNRLREDAEKELAKINCHICENVIFRGNEPHQKSVGRYDDETGEVKFC